MKNPQLNALLRAITALSNAKWDLAEASRSPDFRHLSDTQDELTEIISELDALLDEYRTGEKQPAPPFCPVHNPPPWITNPPRHEITPFLPTTYSPACGASEY